MQVRAWRRVVVGLGGLLSSEFLADSSGVATGRIPGAVSAWRPATSWIRGAMTTNARTTAATRRTPSGGLRSDGRRIGRRGWDVTAGRARLRREVQEPLALEAPGGGADRVGIVSYRGVRAAAPRSPPAPRSRPQRGDRAASGRHRERDGGCPGRGSSDRPPRRAQGRERTDVAQRRASRARLGRQIHDGVEPPAGLAARDQIVRGRLEARRGRRDAQNDATRRAGRSRRAGATGTPNAAAATARAVYGPIPGKRLERRDRRRHPAAVLRRRSSGQLRGGREPAGYSQARPTPPADRASRHRPGPRASASGRRTAARPDRPARSPSAATSPPRPAPATGRRPRGSATDGAACRASGTGAC